MKKFIIILSMFFITAFKTQPFQADVLRVVDGDTIKVELENKPVNVRLARIDCFETYNNKRAKKQIVIHNLSLDQIKQKGKVSKEFLALLILNKKIYLEIVDTGYYNRPIVEAYYIENDKYVNINDLLLSKGGCVVYN